MSKKYIKKYWVIEKKSRNSDEVKLLAILDARKSVSTVIEAMRSAMMTDSNDFMEKLSLQKQKRGDRYYPSRCYSKFPFLLAGDPLPFRAPFKAWITEFDTRTGNYISFDIKFKEYIKRLKKIHGENL